MDEEAHKQHLDRPFGYFYYLCWLLKDPCIPQEAERVCLNQADLVRYLLDLFHAIKSIYQLRYPQINVISLEKES